ncbi:hypothetical protein [Methylobacterium sp. J-090]|nr:hypothetical protein [Methylobacterium sp. J-090]
MDAYRTALFERAIGRPEVRLFEALEPQGGCRAKGDPSQPAASQ